VTLEQAEECGYFSEEALTASLLIDAVRVTYAIVKAGGMASKSIVEDVLMLKHGVGRDLAHDLTNLIESINMSYKGIWDHEDPNETPTKYTAMPTIAEYAEYLRVVYVKWYQGVPSELKEKADATTSMVG